MNKPMPSFVCDRCGNLWKSYRALRCPACLHTSLWQFDNHRAAFEHSMLIRDPHSSLRPLA